jgi:hypothetical protein
MQSQNYSLSAVCSEVGKVGGGSMLGIVGCSASPRGLASFNGQGDNLAQIVEQEQERRSERYVNTS